MATTIQKNKTVYGLLLKNPRITEKAAALGINNAYTFEVSGNATKSEVAKAVKALYKVTPTKVNIIVSKSKAVVVRGKSGRQSGMKKAIVFLKKGQTIEFV